jgi:hypothetical protein
MTEPTLQDVIRQAAERQQREVSERIIETQIKIVTAAYDRAMAYTNIVVVAGYATFFGLWSLTKPFLEKTLALRAALLMCVSAAIFVLFEVYKMAFTAHHLNKRYLALSDRLKDRTPDQVLAELQGLETEAKKATLRFLRAWQICLLIAAFTGVGAIGMLGYALIRALLSGAS